MTIEISDRTINVKLSDMETTLRISSIDRIKLKHEPRDDRWIIYINAWCVFSGDEDEARSQYSRLAPLVGADNSSPG